MKFKTKSAPLYLSFGGICLMLGFAGLTSDSGEEGMGIFFLILGIVIIISGVIYSYFQVKRENEEYECEQAAKEAQKAEQLANQMAKQTKSSSTSASNPSKPPSQQKGFFVSDGGPKAYFYDLYDRIIHLEKYGVHNYIDLCLYTLFKVRLCFVHYVTEQDLSEDEQTDIIGMYDVEMYISFGLWMQKYAPQFQDPMGIAESRMTMYEKVLLRFGDSAFAMSYLSLTLFHLLDNGWERKNHIFATTPKSDFDISYLTKQLGNRKYQAIIDELEPVIFSFFAISVRDYYNLLSEELKNL